MVAAVWRRLRPRRLEATLRVRALSSGLVERAYEGELVVTNRQPYAVRQWRVDLSPGSGRLAWVAGGRAALAAGCLVIHSGAVSPGGTAVVRFGGSGTPPSRPRAVQLAPLPDPGRDEASKRRGAFGRTVLAPCVDMGEWAAGRRPRLPPGFYTLGYVGSCGGTPAWAGIVPVHDQPFAEVVRGVRLRGGDVIVSFGGPVGAELAQDVSDPARLADAYQGVVDAYALAWVDFDLEGEALADPAVVDRRNKAIARLQRRNPGLCVSFSLPALPGGLVHEACDALANARDNGVRPDVVTALAMDFGDAAAPNPAGRMAAFARQAALNTRVQVVRAGLADARIGITLCIGVNDVESEVVTPADATAVARFVAGTPWVRYLSFWSVNRDRDDGVRRSNPGSSGVRQRPHDFMAAFRAGMG